MTKEERVKAVLAGQEVDRIPASVWMHISEFDQDPRALAEAMVDFNTKFDFDFVKMMPFGAYTVPDEYAVNNIVDRSNCHPDNGRDRILQQQFADTLFS